ncbi:cuticle protein 16.8-like [Dermacentor albipictus]|uniref:cuticle protein 16.8-like n=1 Tax=Dermacentor albipictus TaxID=60249 RepID=UPI0038FCE870
MFCQIIIASLAGCVSAGRQFGFQGYGNQYGDPLVSSATGGSFAAAEPFYPPQPYNFGYDSVDEFGTQTYRKEQGDASNTKKGSYGYRDASGMFRRVDYVADAYGYRANVQTNEPGTAPGGSADAVFDAKPRAASAALIQGAASGHYAHSARAPASAGFGGFSGPLPWAG